jgi:hypothetical protein
MISTCPILFTEIPEELRCPRCYWLSNIAPERLMVDPMCDGCRGTGIPPIPWCELRSSANLSGLR